MRNDGTYCGCSSLTKLLCSNTALKRCTTRKFSETEKKHAKVICQYTSAYIAEQKTRVFVQWVQSFNRYWVERVLR